MNVVFLFHRLPDSQALSDVELCICVVILSCKNQPLSLYFEKYFLSVKIFLIIFF